MSTEANSAHVKAAAAEPLRLDTLQQGLLKPRIESFLAAASDEPSRIAWRELSEAVENLAVPSPLAGRLAALLEVTLAGGRLRREASPGAETSLASLYQKTPRGREIAASVGSLNKALAELKGHTIESMSASLRGPGSYALTIRTGALQIVIRLQDSGAGVESVEVGLG